MAQELSCEQNLHDLVWTMTTVESQNTTSSDSPRAGERPSRDSALLYVWIFTAATVVFLPPILARWTMWNLWRTWEFIAITCELAYSALFFIICAKSQPPIFLAFSSPQLRKAVKACLLAGWVALSTSLLLSMTSVQSGLLCLTVAAICFSGVDYLFGWQSDGNPRDPEFAWNFRMAFFFADVPVFLGFGALLFYALALPNELQHSEAESKELHSFVAGAVALQLLLSIIVFGILFWLRPRNLGCQIISEAPTVR